MKQILKTSRAATCAQAIRSITLLVAVALLIMPGFASADWTINGMTNDGNGRDDVNLIMGWNNIPWVGDAWDADDNVVMIGEITASSTKTITADNAVAFGRAGDASIFTISDNATITFGATTLTNLAQPSDLTIETGSTLTTGALTVNCPWTMSSGELTATGNVTIGTGADVEMNGTATATLNSLWIFGDPDPSFSITAAGATVTVTTTFTPEDGIFSLDAGTLIVQDDIVQHFACPIDITGGTLQCDHDFSCNTDVAVSEESELIVTGAFSLNFGGGNQGNFTQSGESSVTVGSVVQAVDCPIGIGTGSFICNGTFESYEDVTITDNASVTLTGDVTVIGSTLILTSGVIESGGSITLGGIVDQNEVAGAFTIAELCSLKFNNEETHSNLWVSCGSEFTVTGTNGNLAFIGSESGVHWGQIFQIDGSTTLSYTHIMGGGDPVQVIQAPATIEIDGGSFSMSNTELSNSQSGGVLIVSADATNITTSSIHNVEGDGIEIWGPSAGKICNNFIYDNTTELTIPVEIISNYVGIMRVMRKIEAKNHDFSSK